MLRGMCNFPPEDQVVSILRHAKSQDLSIDIQLPNTHQQTYQAGYNAILIISKESIFPPTFNLLLDLLCKNATPLFSPFVLCPDQERVRQAYSARKPVQVN